MLANELISRGPQSEKTYLLSRSSSGKVRWQYGRVIQISMDDRARVVAGPANIVAQPENSSTMSGQIEVATSVRTSRRLTVSGRQPIV